MTTVSEIFQESSQNAQRSENVQHFHTDPVDDELVEEDMSISTVVDNDQQRIRELQNEVVRFRNEAEASKLKARARRFRAKIDATTFAESFSAITEGVSASRERTVFDDGETAESVTIFHKSLKSDKLKNYKELFEKEHRHWMRDAKLAFIKSFDYFSDDRTKILWCMTFLIGDSQAQWFSHCANDLKLNDVTFDDFENFLLNLIADSVNRRLNVYERWEKAKQNSNQKITAFKVYLKDLKSHLFEFEEIYKAFIFFAKLRHELKQKIFDIGSVSDTRKDILKIVIMQKKNLKRQRNGDGDDENSNFNQNRKFKSSKGGKFQNNQNSQQQFSQINQFKQKSFTRAAVKRSRKFDNVKICNGSR